MQLTKNISIIDNFLKCFIILGYRLNSLLNYSVIKLKALYLYW